LSAEDLGVQLDNALKNARSRYDEARNGDEYPEILSTSIEVAFRSAMALAFRNGVKRSASRGSVTEKAASMADACSGHLQAKGENYQVVWARDTFLSVAALQLALNRPNPDAALRLIEATALSIDLGQKIALVAMAIDNVWDSHAAAEAARSGLSKGGKNKQPDWESRFAPIARSFCAGKDKVSLGDLVRRARKWAVQEIGGGRSVSLPTSAKGITDGLKRMEMKGELQIPGRERKG
jgi:hypothetical protein